ncbi:MAG: D-inositol-3-phosphate glycosyltransferase [Phycisphaerae bacterium]|nr:D-inositol-3-phosphate glycosyltransferase [Phycisphaerae bacterium]
MKIALLAAGAGEMLCGSCLHDNTLARALRRAGHDALLIPAYTPLRTDEPIESHAGLFFGGVNVYLQQRVPLFRHTPRWLDRWLDSGALLRWLTRRVGDTDPAGVADLTISMLSGTEGNQRKELARLCAWLRDELRPDIVQLPTELFLGMAAEIRRTVGVPVVCELNGADIFIDRMRAGDAIRVKALVRQNAVHADALICPSRFYAGYMASYYDLPPARFSVVPLGITLEGCRPEPRRRAAGEPLVIGYLARICQEKGLHVLAEAAGALLHAGAPPFRVRAAGYLPAAGKRYLGDVRRVFARHRLADRFEYAGELDRDAKLRFLQSLDLFSVPATMQEPKGLSVLEALANGVAVVLPAHGSFPELVAETGAGVLAVPNDPRALAAALHELLRDEDRRLRLARAGAAAVHAGRSADKMALATAEVYRVAAGAAPAGEARGEGGAGLRADRSSRRE